jgi:hypothetical protein
MFEVKGYQSRKINYKSAHADRGTHGKCNESNIESKFSKIVIQIDGVK